jgi:hypothetical protein
MMSLLPILLFTLFGYAKGAYVCNNQVQCMFWRTHARLHRFSHSYMPFVHRYLAVGTFTARPHLTPWHGYHVSIHHTFFCVVTRRLIVQVEAERVPDVSSHLSVTAVPTFVFLNHGDVTDRLEGFDPAGLYTKAAKLQAAAANSSKSGAVLSPASAGATTADLNTRLKELVCKEPVMLFMKGSPDVPRCGFSRRVVDALRNERIPFGDFDILQDVEVSTCAAHEQCVCTHKYLSFSPAGPV